MGDGEGARVVLDSQKWRTQRWWGCRELVSVVERLCRCDGRGVFALPGPHPAVAY